MESKGRNTEERVQQEGKWLRVKLIQFAGADGRLRTWEAIERTTTRQAEVDAVEIVATLRRAGREPAVVLLRQYRPPVNAWVIELPAGLLDRGETAEIAAIRELKEETGFTGTVSSCSPFKVFFGQAISNTSSKVAFVDIDGDSPVNAAPKQDLGDLELISVLVVPVSELRGTLDRFSASGHAIDGKLYCLLSGHLNAAGW